MSSFDHRPNTSDPADAGSPRVTGRPGWDQHPGVRSGRRLGRGERAADLVCRAVGPWTYLLMIAIGVAGVAAAVPHYGQAGRLVRLAVGVAVLTVVEMALILMAARRGERIATDLALYHLEQARRATAVVEDLREEMRRLHADVARIAAFSEKASVTARQL
jgi:hypothetical protein